jgi:hypothetical protein
LHVTLHTHNKQRTNSSRSSLTVGVSATTLFRVACIALDSAAVAAATTVAAAVLAMQASSRRQRHLQKGPERQLAKNACHKQREYLNRVGRV